MLGGDLPEPMARKGRTKTAQLAAALGWRILPVPQFWQAHQMWRNREGTDGNSAYIDFKHPREWLVIPPDDTGMPAQKIEGGSAAIRWAEKQATSGRTPA
jgi:hypothetical protein